MQAIARMVNHWVNPAAVKTVQIGCEIGADLVRRGSALTWGQFVVLMDIRLFQSQQLFFGLGQASGGHSPRTNGRAHQVNGLVAAWQPMAK